MTSKTSSATENFSTIGADSEDVNSNYLKSTNQKAALFDFNVSKLSGNFFARMMVNLIAVFILVRFIYYPNYPYFNLRKKYKRRY